MKQDTQSLAISPTGSFAPETPPLYVAENGGVIRIQGTRISLDTVIGAFHEGCSPEQIVERYPSLRLAATYAVIAYYLQHGGEVDAYLVQRQKQAAILRGEIEKLFPREGVRERLQTRLDAK